MRVLVDGRIGWGAGIGRVIAETVPRVAALQPDIGFDLLVNHKDGERAQSAIGACVNATVKLTDVQPFSAREQLALPHLSREYDLTWFTNYWVPLRHARPFVVTVHDVLHLHDQLFPASRVKRTLSRATFAKVRRDADVVMFDSRFTAREFLWRVGKPRRSQVVHLGADHLPEIEPAALPGKERRLLIVAASKYHKNFAMALQAWAAAQVGRDWRLTIVTPGDPMRSSIDLAQFAREAERVDIVQGVDDSELAALYQRSAILLMPSHYEGFGLPLLEGLRAGAWCISSTAAALVEIGEGAFIQFVDPADRQGWTAAMEWACGEWERRPELLFPLIRHNLVQARHYTWSRTAEQVAGVLRGVLSSHSSR